MMSVTSVARLPPGGLPAAVTAQAAPERGTRSLRVDGLVKEYHTAIGVRRVLDGISFDVQEGEKVGVLGRNGSGKTTLVKLIGGVEVPTSGTIHHGMFTSWPVGLLGGVTGLMTGAASVRFIARLYGCDASEMVDFVNDFAELGRQIENPIETYSSGMRARLTFALSLAVDFECFLIDEVFAVGDQRFHRKCHDALFHKRRHRAMILVSHSTGIIREYCRKVLVLKAGRGKVFDDLDLAVSIYNTL